MFCAFDDSLRRFIRLHFVRAIAVELGYTSVGLAYLIALVPKVNCICKVVRHRHLLMCGELAVVDLCRVFQLLDTRPASCIYLLLASVDFDKPTAAVVCWTSCGDCFVKSAIADLAM